MRREAREEVPCADCSAPGPIQPAPVRFPRSSGWYLFGLGPSTHPPLTLWDLGIPQNLWFKLGRTRCHGRGREILGLPRERDHAPPPGVRKLASLQRSWCQQCGIPRSVGPNTLLPVGPSSPALEPWPCPPATSLSLSFPQGQPTAVAGRESEPASGSEHRPLVVFPRVSHRGRGSEMLAGFSFRKQLSPGGQMAVVMRE